MKLGNRNLIFILLVIFYPVSAQFYQLMPDIQIPGYNYSDTFFFWLGKSLGFLGILVAFRLTIESWQQPLYRYAWYLLFFYGLVDLYLVMPFSTDEHGFPIAIAFAAIVSLTVMMLGPWVSKMLHFSLLQKLQHELKREQRLNQYLEFNADELHRLLKSVTRDDTDKILIAHAYQLKMIQKAAFTDPGLEKLYYQKSEEMLEAAVAIKRKTAGFRALKPEEAKSS